MTQSSLKFAPLGTNWQPSVDTTSKRYSVNYGNNKPTPEEST